MTLIICLALLATIATVLFAGGWIPVIYLRARLKTFEAAGQSTANVGMNAYRSPDPNSVERLETYSHLTERLALWEMRQQKNMTRLRRGRYPALALILLALGGLGVKWAYINLFKEFQVDVTIVDKFWLCEVGRSTESGDIDVDHWVQGENWTWGRTDTASCPTYRGNTDIYSTQVRYFILLESNSEYHIIHRGERYISRQNASTYQQMRIGATDWQHTVNGTHLHAIELPFPSLNTQRGEPWVKR